MTSLAGGPLRPPVDCPHTHPSPRPFLPLSPAVCVPQASRAQPGCYWDPISGCLNWTLNLCSEPSAVSGHVLHRPAGDSVLVPSGLPAAPGNPS